MPILTVFGNHDALINGGVQFKKYFQTKQDKYYYRFDEGNLHIIVLNLLWDSQDFNREQKNWLIQQLESIPQEDIVITLHHAYGYASGYVDPHSGMLWYDIPDMINNVDTLLESYNVELDLAGHNHFFQYLINKNTSYGIVGQMGGIQDLDKDYTSPKSIWYDNTNFGFLGIDIYDNHLELNYKDQRGKVLYSTTINNNR
ncbi:MAG: hypothetical protein BKP49_06450 [Treponema sp. CETP13]|nr:MAG: hypothetical protein BKP49_06450 [Treponema sp. CETP13]